MRFILSLTLFISMAAAHAATVTGTVTLGNGNGVRASLVTLTSHDGLLSETVFTDQTGRFHIATQQHGALTLRARAPYLADASEALELPADDSSVVRRLTLRELTDVQNISDSLPASAHFTRVKFPTPIARQQFQTDCLSCHQLGNPFTRKARTPEQWNAILTLMLQYAGYTSQTHLHEYVDALERAFDGSPTRVAEHEVVKNEVLKARIVEWKLPGAVIAHDSEVGPADGKFYTVDQGVDVIYVTDPVVNSTTSIPLPEGGVRIGGRFAERGLPIPFNLSVRHGVHSLQFGPDGRLYITGAIGGEIGVFDVSKRTYEAYPIGGTSLYPHTLRFDKQGIVWFTMSQSNQVGRFDPSTGQIKVIDLPRGMVRQDEREPLPYGLDVNPLDGTIWYSKLWANKIGRIDPNTLAVTEFVPPIVGPRRLRFDATGMLWIPGFGDGTLVRLDTRTMTYRSFRIPTLSPGEVEAPYAVAVNPHTQDVWITANMSDRVFRFDPKTLSFTVYPLPVRGTYSRDFFFTRDGKVCAPTSPMPPRPEVLEGGMDAIVCIEPAGNVSG
jgi:DNA-binding beta-propeller fold protein YncE